MVLLIFCTVLTLLTIFKLESVDLPDIRYPYLDLTGLIRLLTLQGTQPRRKFCYLLLLQWRRIITFNTMLRSNLPDQSLTVCNSRFVFLSAI